MNTYNFYASGYVHILHNTARLVRPKQKKILKQQWMQLGKEFFSRATFDTRALGSSAIPYTHKGIWSTVTLRFG
jgi:hypothetical protein